MRRHAIVRACTSSIGPSCTHIGNPPPIIPAKGDLCITTLCYSIRTEAEAHKMNWAAMGRTIPNSHHAAAFQGRHTGQQEFDHS